LLHILRVVKVFDSPLKTPITSLLLVTSD